MAGADSGKSADPGPRRDAHVLPQRCGLATAHLEQTADIERTVMESLAAAGPDARVCVLPEGPQTIPYLPGQGTAE